jgi:aminoglycoside phosphotransferase family enzyme/predicted kinase
MELDRLIAALSEPGAYPDAVDAVEVRQTHISVVFLAGAFAYKIKKPLQLEFLDYSTLEARRTCCEREVVLNRRLAPRVYLGVVAVTTEGSEVKLERPGEPIEWAVKMARLPEDATLQARLRGGHFTIDQLEELARRIAQFHQAAESGPHVSACGRFETVAAHARANLEAAGAFVGRTISAPVLARLSAGTERALDSLRPLIESRAVRGMPRDTHGDLRLDHVYHFPERPAPDDWVIVDCIEFNKRFRYADPVADVSFLAMDLILHGRRDLARIWTEASIRANGDEEGRCLWPFYVAYRAAVRGKVEEMKTAEAEISPTDRAAATANARACWLVALGELEPPGQRPCLVLVGGLPGAGKSTLARGLAERATFAVIRSDEVRKELAGSTGSMRAAFGEGIYTPEWNERTYDECLRRAERLIAEGRRVVVDASFGAEANRSRFIGAAVRWGVPALLFVCHADPDVIRARLAARHGDVSDADWAIREQAAARWETIGPVTRASTHEVATDGETTDAVGVALEILGAAQLHGEARAPYRC